jgi:hypothetical protein
MKAVWPLPWNLEPYIPASGEITEPAEGGKIAFMCCIRRACFFPPGERDEWVPGILAALSGAPSAEQVLALPPRARESFARWLIAEIAGPGWLDAMIRIGELEAAS